MLINTNENEFKAFLQGKYTDYQIAALWDYYQYYQEVDGQELLSWKWFDSFEQMYDDLGEEIYSLESFIENLDLEEDEKEEEWASFSDGFCEEFEDILLESKPYIRVGSGYLVNMKKNRSPIGSLQFTL